MTRKLLSIAMALILAAFPFAALADAASTEAPTEPAEILFRGMPWDTTPSAFQAAIDADARAVEQEWVSLWDKCSSNHLTAYADDGIGYLTDYYIDAPIYQYTGVAGGQKFTVAGLPVVSIDAYAVPENKIDTSLDNAKIVWACYTLNIKSFTDQKAVAEDLIAKLTSLYGEPAVTPPEFFEDLLLYGWYGGNDTYCKLGGAWDGQNGYAVLSLEYGKTNIPDLLLPLMTDSNSIDSSDLSGL